MCNLWCSVIWVKIVRPVLPLRAIHQPVRITFTVNTYSAAKAGIIGFTKALAQEGARKGVTVNVVAPGYVNTDMVAAVPENVLQSIIATIPVGRLGEADDIARAVLFLASDAAGFVTGSTLTVNGGQYIT